jgi:hypothetical protein
VNSLWSQQPDPYGGDVINSYNDGPVAPGQPSLGGFYEVETSSPAAALAPGESIEHVHATLHVTGTAAALDALARKVLGVALTSLPAPYERDRAALPARAVGNPLTGLAGVAGRDGSGPERP